MKALLTGMNGTVAPALAKHLAAAGHEVVAWKREEVSIDDFATVRAFIVRTKPDWFFHIATGDPKWAEKIAQACNERGTKLLYTGSVSVYAGSQRGPFAIDATPQPDDDYGRYKFDCERLVRAAFPDALVARLAWQIGDAPGSNNMMSYLDRTFKEKGRIEASANWFPACAFLEDTADALTRLMTSYPRGLYQLDGNPGVSFFEIASGLNRLHGNPWTVERVEVPDRNNRMLDPKIKVRPLTERLG